jgi:transaldolase/glucose-6-phosphate isomerase
VEKEHLMNPLLELHNAGQSIWLDYIRRSLMSSGQLKSLIANDGLRGMTSNPTIFQKAIAGSNEYDDALRVALSNNPHAEAKELYEALMFDDVRTAADVFRPVYDSTNGADGFVSVEVSPQLAYNTEGTIAEVRRYWETVNRPNVMVKIPATPQGIPAIEQMIAEGININITLMFSMEHYEAVANAYLRGIARCKNPERVASVASVFVSRIDTLADKQLEALGSPEAKKLLGTIAVANAKMIYQRFKEIFYGNQFEEFSKRGVRVQRPLWASTGTKNPAYSDVLYVESLIGKDTVNTLPPATLNAFRDHGKVNGTAIEEDLGKAKQILSDASKAGLNLHSITDELQEKGVAAFIKSFEELMNVLKERRRTMDAERIDRQVFALGSLRSAVTKRLDIWQKENFGERLWRKDYTLWSDGPVPEITDRMGWLNLPETSYELLDGLVSFSQEIRSEGFVHVVLLGMGGSSLAPDMFQHTFGNSSGNPQLIVLDSTHPAAVESVRAKINPKKSLFIVSSKSGTTIEPNSFYHYFWNLVVKETKTPGKNFIAITDPGTPLEKLAHERKFRQVFRAASDVGGRYSALTAFGIVPAALIGMNVHRLLDQAWAITEASAFCIGAHSNPALVLGASLGELAAAGKDKATFITSPSLSAFPSWLEQLIAESTGKDNKGIIPVAEEPLLSASQYGSDRLFVYLRLENDDNGEVDAHIQKLEASGQPVIRIRLEEKYDLGQEIFRWEMAVAAAGAALKIHPFNQPDVELAKKLARDAMKKESDSSKNAVEEISAGGTKTLRDAVAQWIPSAKAGDYFGIQAYIAPTEQAHTVLQSLRKELSAKTNLATTLGYGPRFLHSTGQLHKGGPNTGVFLQLVDEPKNDVPVPETDYSFRRLLHAQSIGDYLALKQRNRRILRVNLGGDVSAGLAALAEALRD